MKKTDERENPIPALIERFKSASPEGRQKSLLVLSQAIKDERDEETRNIFIQLKARLESIEKEKTDENRTN